jgi:hypothetical protein
MTTVQSWKPNQNCFGGIINVIDFQMALSPQLRTLQPSRHGTMIVCVSQQTVPSRIGGSNQMCRRKVVLQVCTAIRMQPKFCDHDACSSGLVVSHSHS